MLLILKELNNIKRGRIEETGENERQPGKERKTEQISSMLSIGHDHTPH